MNNKTYCKFPFVGFQVNYKGNKLCCVTNKFVPNKAEEFWNSDYIADVRNKMLSNTPLSECTNCYKTEEKNTLSLRYHYNSRYNGWSTNNLPIALDLDFSNFCNLKCIMCNSSRSSQWAKEEGINTITNGISTISKKQIDNLCNISEKVRHITIQGGEPSLMPEFEYYFQFLKDNNLIQNIEVDCITNLTNINNKFFKMLNNFKHVNLNVSIDSFDMANDYIRFPSNFKKIEENLIKLTDKNIKVNIQLTLQTLTMYNFYNFLVWLNTIQTKFKEKNKILGLNLSRVHNPDCLDIDFAPQKLKQHFVNDIKKYKKKYKLNHDMKFNMEIRKLELNLLSNNKDNKWQELKSFIHTLDTKRNIKVTNYIKEFYNYADE